ncbi:GNAT family N-acetyltransferase [Clostridium sp. WILCCON 0269]|uniref:GNAT family N-acetyltransferase n=1 Tax=Candidatus Clostridium eludens TaxID=3381663 RepID=A0ABW8SRD2_9CLOT
MNYFIREIQDKELSISIRIIRLSFLTVAEEFNLTKKNCPTNGAFIETERLIKDKARGIKMFGLFTDNIQIGFVAIAKQDDDTYEMEKLSVLPEYRHNDYGKALITYVKNYVEFLNGKIIKIGIIEENKILKQWYLSCGFTEKGTSSFSHLPFTVGFMELIL